MTVGVVAMLVVAYLACSILREPRGQRQMEKMADYIEEGAKAYKHAALLIAPILLLL